MVIYLQVHINIWSSDNLLNLGPRFKTSLSLSPSHPLFWVPDKRLKDSFSSAWSLPSMLVLLMGLKQKRVISTISYSFRINLPNMTYYWDIRYEAFLSLDRVYLQISLEETSSNPPCDDSNDYSCLFYYGDSWSYDFISVVAARKNEEHGSQVPWSRPPPYFFPLNVSWRNSTSDLTS